MTEHLTDVELSPEQEARVPDLLVAMVGMSPRAARLIVHLQDELAKAQVLIESEWFQRVTYKQQLRAALDKLEKPAHEREMPHCSTCSCGMECPRSPDYGEPVPMAECIDAEKCICGAAKPPGDEPPLPLWRNDRCQHEGCHKRPVDGMFCADHPGDGQQ